MIGGHEQLRDDVLTDLAVELAGWLVGQDETRLADQGAGDRRALRLPAGDLIRQLLAQTRRA